MMELHRAGRRLAWIASGLLAASLAPAAADAADEPRKPLAGAAADDILARWERRVSGLKTVDVRFTRTDHNPLFNTTEERSDCRLAMRAAGFAYLDWGFPDRPERLIWTPEELGLYLKAQRRLFVFPRNLSFAPPLEVLGLPFLPGMRADDVRRAYEVEVSELSAMWIVRLTPRDAPARREFAHLTVGLNKQTMLPDAFRIDKNGRSTTILRFRRVGCDAALPDDLFRIECPEGWREYRSEKGGVDVTTLKSRGIRAARWLMLGRGGAWGWLRLWIEENAAR